MTETNKEITTSYITLKDLAALDEIKESINDIYNKGYNKGYKNGIANNSTSSEKIKEAYNNGMNDAWECAKKISLDECDNGIDVNELRRIFGVANPVHYKIMKKFSAQEAIDKIKAWEESQEHINDEIKIGDEVNAPGFHAPVVVIALCDYDSVKVMSSLGATGVHPKCNVTKTGKHFNQISEVLEQLEG